MDSFAFIIENIVFWAFVYIIVFMGCDTPAIVFSGFSLFLVYWILRFVFSKQGWDRIGWMYALNMFVTILLLYYFVTGATIGKTFRNYLNSAAQRYPPLSPYLKRC